MRHGFHHLRQRRRSRRGRHQLRQRLFVWFGVTIVCSGAVVAGVFALLGPDAGSWRNQRAELEQLVASQYRDAWSRPDARRALSERLHRALDLTVQTEDARGGVLERFGNADCRVPAHTIEIEDGRAVLGRVHACDTPRHNIGALLAALLAAGFVLWLASAVIARRLTSPFAELVRVTREIGAGQLSARVRLGRHGPGEVGFLADAINDMAERIEKQLHGERELLARVSHEIRSPLARLRLLAELAREPATQERAIHDLERELIEIDELVAKLLATSRLDFDALTLKRLNAAEQALRALEVAGLPPTLLEDRAPEKQLVADPTLLARALGNLLENAQSHGGGVKALRISATGSNGSEVCFEVDDAGPGFQKADLPQVFEPFFRSGQRGHGSLGLGLSLVERIARAHAGAAFALNLPGGGARVGFRLRAVE